MAPKAKSKSGSRSRSSTPPTPGGSAKSKAKAKAKASQNAVKPPSREDIAATRLQAMARTFLARRLLRRMREEKRRYEEEAAEAIRQTELAVLRQEQRRVEAERAKAEEKRRKARKLAEDTKKALEAAYDGEIETLRALLDGGLVVDAADPKGITALSEAASGGAEEVVKLLLEQKSNPNSRGEFDRTPLWRAVYSSHASVARLLLDQGADPRLYDSDGCCPVDVCREDGLATELRSWDVTKTDELVEDFESWAESVRLAEAFKVKEAMRSVDAEYDAAKAVYEASQKTLARAKAEFRNREKEHGVGLAAGNDHAIQSCASAYSQVEQAEAEYHAAQARFDKANLSRIQAAEDCGAVVATIGREVKVQDLNNVLIRDIGERIAKGDKWSLVIDPGEVAKKMLVYSGSAVLSFWKAEDMHPDRVRRALLTMLRAGGALAIDLAMFAGGVDRELLAQPFEDIRKGLFDDLLSRVELQTPKGSVWPRFKELLRPEDKGSIMIEQFDQKRTQKFKLMLVTTTETPHPDLLEIFDVLRVTVPN